MPRQHNDGKANDARRIPLQAQGSSTPEDAGGQERIIIVSENSPMAIRLTRQLAGKGYRIFSMPPFSDFSRLEAERPALIVLVDCADACAAITGQLRPSNGIPAIPVICMSDGACSGKQPGSEQIHIEEFLPGSVAMDALESRIRFWRHPLHQDAMDASALPGLLSHERRQPVDLTEPAATVPFAGSDGAAARQEAAIALSAMQDAPCAKDDNDLITLLIISQRQHLPGKLLAHLGGTPDIRLFSKCLDRLELVPVWLERLRPGLLIVDTALSGPAIAGWLSAIRKKDAAVKIILLCDPAAPDCIHEIVEFGITGQIPADTNPGLYEKAIRTVHKGELWLSHRLTSQVFAGFFARLNLQRRNATTRSPDAPDAASAAFLTAREQCIAGLVAQGLTNKQIARQLVISPDTIKKHLGNIFDKLGMCRRSQLAAVQGKSTAGRHA